MHNSHQTTSSAKAMPLLRPKQRRKILTLGLVFVALVSVYVTLRRVSRNTISQKSLVVPISTATSLNLRHCCPHFWRMRQTCWWELKLSEKTKALVFIEIPVEECRFEAPSPPACVPTVETSESTSEVNNDRADSGPSSPRTPTPSIVGLMRTIVFQGRTHIRMIWQQKDANDRRLIVERFAVLE